MNDNILWLNKLVPKHVLLKESDIEGKLSPLNITREQLPKILLKKLLIDLVIILYIRAYIL